MSKDIIEEYSELEDFGFSAGPDAYEIESAQQASDDTVQKLADVEKKIMPLLTKLLKTADESDTIYWPNRKEILEQRIDEILKLTRGEDYESD